jgi:DNA-binding HxlR family transcriptional regulator
VRRTRFDDWDCSIARSVDILGDWWTPMVIRAALMGARRFEQFSESLGIPRNVLTERLVRLVDEGIMKKVQYQERPVRYEYRLTDKGIGLYPVIVSMMEWGNQWLDWEVDPPVELVDRETGERIDPVLVDRRTGEPLDPRKTRAVYRPGRGVRPGSEPAPAKSKSQSKRLAAAGSSR